MNSFGFGGSNSHCVVDDAYHFLKTRGLVGNHCTVIEPPVVRNLSVLESLILHNNGDELEHQILQLSYVVQTLLAMLKMWS